MTERFGKWISGLDRTRKVAFGRISSFLGATEINPGTWEDLEAMLVQADLGIDVTEEVITSLQAHVAADGLTKTSELSEYLEIDLQNRLPDRPVLDFSAHRPAVILLVGVNGSGKTTTIAKLAKRYTGEGKKVVLGAADTFRAAAVDQLQAWGKRLNVPVIAGQEGGDSAAVAYDTIQAAIARKADYALIDTAGRLHTRYNLMEELKKVHRVTSKALPGAPHATWLVLDANTGQNALQQARAFKDAVQVTGVILAKLDSSARGGMAFAIQHELALPILYAGLGEHPDDLQPFDKTAFVKGIFS
ncbi:MAG: signal recognition particle-docking protein FtsY [Anaerolineaceae bacterium]|jgi:fused signal recognition particle receptor|nr:signal recognition particle-docking protein FtsY [Anaerolineaceae bacterium]